MVSPSSLYILHCRCKVRVLGLVSGPDYSPLAHQFVTLWRLVCGSAGVARRHASRTSSLVTVLVTR